MRHVRCVRESAGEGAALDKVAPFDARAEAAAGAGPLDALALSRALAVSRALSLGHERRLVPQRLVDRGQEKAAWRLRVAGLGGQVTVEGCYEAQLRLACVGAAIGLAAGAAFSAGLATLLAVCGLAFGWRLLPAAITRRAVLRAQEMERHLPEMLDVVALGMRSGLSFDRSVELYVQHFDTLLARAFAGAQQQWVCGLARRDEALRSIADSYDSPLFRRVVEGMVRSLRFGSSMAESLEAAAREARAGYRARKQEQVAKAPVKMMVPTGVLILPAMLIMVLGPVLLELMEGF